MVFYDFCFVTFFFNATVCQLLCIVYFSLLSFYSFFFFSFFFSIECFVDVCLVFCGGYFFVVVVVELQFFVAF